MPFAFSLDIIPYLSSVATNLIVSALAMLRILVHTYAYIAL